MKNPFFYDETEIYTVEEIYKLFVQNESILSNLYHPRHNFICGDRGTGKSMYLRYLEPYCQFELHKGWKNFIKKDDAFIAFYFPIPKSLINIKEFQARNIPAGESLFAHYFNMLITEKIIQTMQTQLVELPKNEFIYSRFAQEFINIINPLKENISAVDKLFNKSDDQFIWINQFISDEKTRITDFINFFTLREVKYLGCLTDYYNFILPLVQLIKKLYDFDKSIFFLIDDAGNVFDFQQKIFNSWIANRNHKDLSIKISTVPSLYKTFLTVDDNFIDGKNDFLYVHLDNYGSKSEFVMKSEIIEIIEKRLSEYEITYNAENFFLEDSSQKQKIEEARKQVAESIEKNDRIKDKRRYINRNTMSRFYKNMDEERAENDKTSLSRTYSGITDIISFSSYNIRDCLKICSRIFDKAYSKSEKENIMPISSTLQDRIINEISKSEVVGITLFKEQYDSTIIALMRELINSLGNLYRANLINYDYSEYGITAFQTIMLSLKPDEKEAIKIAVENRYLMRRFYSERDGRTINVAYALNKMFFPYFKLELLPFAGRIKIQPKDFSLAFTDMQAFIKAVAPDNSKKKEENISRNQISIFEYSDEVEDGIDDLKNNLSELF